MSEQLGSAMPVDITGSAVGVDIDSFQLASSPDTNPYPSSEMPSTRRQSTSASSVANMSGISSPKSGSTSPSVLSEATAAIFEVADKKLEQLVLTEESTPTSQPAEMLSTEIPSPTKRGPFQFECAFGFTGQLDEPAAIPKTKAAFLEAIQTEINGTTFIQKGLQSYMREINSRKYHVFSTRFLIHQNTATVITLEQLDQIHEHLQDVVKEVRDIEGDEAIVKDDLIEAFQHAQPWIQRTRRILYESHVFYKINYVLGADHKSTQA